VAHGPTGDHALELVAEFAEEHLRDDLQYSPQQPRGRPTGAEGVLKGNQGVLQGEGVLKGCSRVIKGYSRAKGYSRGAQRYSRGTQGVLKGYSRGTQGVLKGYSRGVLRGH
jgi:hypothetical protein